MTRARLKSWAKDAMGKTYWKSVLVALILGVTAGTGTGSSGSSSSSSSDSSYSHMSQEELIMLATILITVMVISLALVAIGLVIKAFALNPLHVGCQSYFCEGLENPGVSLGMIGKGFKSNYKNVTKTMFFRDLYLFLWSMIMWIPIAFFIGGTVVVAGMEESMGLSSDAVSITMAILFFIFLVCLMISMIPWIVKTYEYMMVPYILTDNPDMDRKEVFALTKKMMTGHKWEAFVLHLSFIGWNILGALTCGILNLFYVAPYKAYTLAAYYKVMYQKHNAPAMPDYGYNRMERTL